MNDAKLEKLFKLSRNETGPVATAGFDAKVMAAARREGRRRELSFWEQLEQLFPRVAVATALIIAACLLTDAGFSAVTGGSLSGDVNELSEQWLFAARN